MQRDDRQTLDLHTKEHSCVVLYGSDDMLWDAALPDSEWLYVDGVALRVRRQVFTFTELMERLTGFTVNVQPI